MSNRLFIEDVMGTNYSQMKQIPLNETFKEMTCTTPIFFVLSPGIDPVRDIEKLGKNMGITGDDGNLYNISLGQGQETIAENAIKEASEKGRWVILQNIHLVVNWLPCLEKVIEKFSSSTDMGSLEDTVNEKYRLFISAEPAPDPKYHVIPQGEFYFLFYSMIIIESESCVTLVLRRKFERE